MKRILIASSIQHAIWLTVACSPCLAWDDDVRWQLGVPPKGNANFARGQHFLHHLAPHGMAGFVLANGSISSNQSGEGDIRRALIEADLLDCMVALPGQLFYSTQIPVCLWLIAKNKNADAKRGFRDQRKQTLFIDARKLGALIDHEQTDADLEKITSTYHAWRVNAGSRGDAQNAEKKNTSSESLRASASPRLVIELHAQFAESAKLENLSRKTASSPRSKERLAKISRDQFHPAFSRFLCKRPKTETGKLQLPHHF